MKFSTNPFEFIRQCHSEGIKDSVEIGRKAWELTHKTGSAEFCGRVQYILSKSGDVDSIILMGQREMVRSLAHEMLGKVLYTQEEFAGKLIALMTEFGVGVALLDQHTAVFGGKIFWTVISYTPDEWGVRRDFETKESAEAFTVQVNSYGTFIL